VVWLRCSRLGPTFRWGTRGSGDPGLCRHRSARAPVNVGAGRRWSTDDEMRSTGAAVKGSSVSLKLALSSLRS